MNSNSVHLIATDPPFNKGRDFHATPDSLASGASFQDRWSWDEDVDQEWVDQITDDFPKVMNVIQGSRNSYGDDMGAFLCFMAVRLLEMRRVLKETGSIYLHCDPTASHYLKELMDAIFGRENFRNDITWRRATAHNDANRYGNITDTILFYVKTKNAYWDGYEASTPKSPEEIAKAYPSKDSRGRYRSDNLTGPLHGAKKGSPSTLPWKGYDVHKLGRCWSAPKTGEYAKYIQDYFIPNYLDIEGVHERLDALDEAGLIYHPKRGKWPGLKRYASADRGVVPQNLILEPIGFTNYNKKSEATGYPTQKPIKLYEIFIKVSSREEDIVLDPFCGCATTLVAAERLGRQWVGIDIWDKAYETVVEQLRKEKLLSPDGNKGGQLLVFGQINHRKDPPERTDEGEEAVPFLKTKLKVDEPKGRRMSRAEMVDYLLDQQGWKCQGCDREFDDPRYLELDHNTPRSDGGLNHISNRILLCGPCNKLKSNTYTLSGLRRQSKKQGYMVGQQTKK